MKALALAAILHAAVPRQTYPATVVRVANGASVIVTILAIDRAQKPGLR